MKDDAEAMNFGGDLAYWFQLGKNAQIGALAGAGYSSFGIDSVRVPRVDDIGNYDGTYEPTQLADSGWEGAFTWNYGAAVKFFVTRSIALQVRLAELRFG